MRLALKAFGVWLALILAVVGGGYVNATLGPAGVAVYGLAVAGVIVALALRTNRRGGSRDR